MTKKESIKCVDCNTVIKQQIVRYRRKYNQVMRCRDCHSKHLLEERDKRLTQKHGKLIHTCVVCGAPIDIRLTEKHRAKPPKTCSPHCHGVYSVRNRKYSKEYTIDLISNYIRNKGSYAGYLEVIKECHIKTTILTRHGISVLQLNKDILGMDCTRPSGLTTVDTKPMLPDVQSLLDMPGKSYKDMISHSTGMYRVKGSMDERRRIVTAVVRGFIHDRGEYTSVRCVCESLCISYPTLVKSMAVNVPAINNEFGFVNRGGSWYEDYVYGELLRFLDSSEVSREHVFTDCRAKKSGYPCRFDFYIPKLNTIIEVDGEQHTSAIWGSQSIRDNDKIKDNYAISKGIRMYRIPAKPRNTFYTRLDDILGVIKSGELLEPLTGNAEGNQQPSPKGGDYNGEGSEIIRKE